jgi:NitT/TauT family transport system substrate-binding protein
MKKSLLILPVAAALLAASAAPARAATPLTAGYLPVTGQAKWFLAKELGFFAEEGIDINLVEFTNSADGLTALRGGKLDVAPFGTTAPLIHISKGADLRIIGGTMGGDVAFVVKKDSPIASLAEFKGKKIATVRLSTGDAVLRGALKRAGIDWRKDTEIFELKGPPAVAEAVKSGQADIGVTWGPHDQRVDEYGLKIIARSKDLQPGHPCCRVIATSEGLAKKEAESKGVWVRFFRAFLKAQKFAFVPENRDKVVDVISKYVKLDKALLEKAYFSDNLEQKTDPNTQGVTEFWNVLLDSGWVEPGPTVPKDIKPFIVPEYYLAALDSLAREQPAEPLWKELQAEFKVRNP